MQEPRSRALCANLALCTLMLAAGCGGGEPERFGAQATADARAHALATPGVIITEQPQSAAVASGSGVAFSVAVGVQGKVITGYLWRRDGNPVFRDTQTSDRSTHSIASVGAAHRGTYSVDVQTTNGTLTSNKATLSITVPGDWAQLGGRVITSSGTAQQPSLALCDEPTLAWIDAGAVTRLRVSRFTGTQWVAMGAALNISTSGAASEPSLDCVEDAGTRRPVVAWSETVATGGRAIQVKAWNGTQWLAVLGNGGPISGVGADARRPVLRLAPVESASLVRPPPIIHSRSALAWVEGGFSRAKMWNGAGWQSYVNGFPAGSGVSASALTLDEVQQPMGGFNTYPPLMVHVSSLSSGHTALAAQAHVSGWSALGLSPSPLSPAASPLRVAGIGFGVDSNGGGAGAVAVWTAGSSEYTIGSSRLFGSEYDGALNHPLDPQPAWAAFAYPFIGVDLHALSFDPRALSTRCADGGSRPTFALAVNDSRGTRVLSARCNGPETDPLDWTVLQRALLGTASGLSLRMESDSVPAMAVSASANGLFELSVWRFFP